MAEPRVTWRWLGVYFLLTFTISWGGIVLVVGPDGLPGTVEDFARLLGPVVVAMLAGPSIAGILSTALAFGRSGLRDFGGRLGSWRVPARWYAIALLTAPVTLMVALLALTSISREFTPGILTAPDPVGHWLFALIIGVAAGFFEELGWTGFAIPLLRRRLGTFSTGLLLGIVWGAWHGLASWWGASPTSGGVSLAIYLPVMLLSFLPPYRILMVWVYDRTRSVLIAMLMHASLTGSIRLLEPIGLSGGPILIFNLALAALLWLAVAGVFLVRRDPIGKGAYSS